ncbi:hypothetical protein [Pendulispora albinea]|uniref:Uncharacterized protein n=1 Tax=Pendulispora albinea TaxID=2741071 RepID=A0ABZ2M9Z0_9BACT
MLSDILTFITTVGWTGAYIVLIYRGFKDKTCGMPLPALALNITWEFTFSFLRPNAIPIQLVSNAVWFFLDLLILYTYLKYGRKEFSKIADPKWMVPWTLAAIATGFSVQHFSNLQFFDDQAHNMVENYCAFFINLIMSVAFVDMLARRRNTEGQSMIVAVGKCLGSLAAGIMNYTETHHALVVVLSIATLLFDVIYIVMLHGALRTERSPHAITPDHVRPLGADAAE